MKLCPACVKNYGEMLKSLLRVKITESKFEECEFGHPKFIPKLPKELAAKTNWQPSDTTNCDIHYEPYIWIYDLAEWYGGLVDFGGCVAAANCGGDCGQVNSKRNHICLRRFSEAPEVFQSRDLWCLYENTGVLDCLNRVQYMVKDYIL